MGKHVLVVESNPDDAFIIQRALNHNPSCSFFFCRSVSDAISYLEKAGDFCDPEKFPPADAILSEMRLDLGSGLELLRWLRQHEQFRTLPFYIFSDPFPLLHQSELKALNVTAIIHKASESAEIRKQLHTIAQEICSSPS